MCAFTSLVGATVLFLSPTRDTNYRHKPLVKKYPRPAIPAAGSASTSTPFQTRRQQRMIVRRKGEQSRTTQSVRRREG